MPWSVLQFYALLPTFVLVLARIAGLMLVAPVFSSAVIPLQIKALLSLAISLTVFPLVMGTVAAPVTLSSALTGLIGEVAIGLFIGFCLVLIFAAVELAIEVVANQSGMKLGEVFNPMMDSSSTEVAQLYQYAAIAIFLSIGGHRDLIRAVLDSFVSVPPLQFSVTEGLLATVVELLAVSFVMAVRIAGPVMVALMLTFMMLGFLSRAVPQLHLLTIGFPIKLALGIFMLALTIMTLEPVFLEGLNTCMDGIRDGLGM